MTQLELEIEGLQSEMICDCDLNVGCEVHLVVEKRPGNNQTKIETKTQKGELLRKIRKDY